jgi:ankyrin repeat protein
MVVNMFRIPQMTDTEPANVEEYILSLSNCPNINYRDNNGNTLLHYAIDRFNNKRCEFDIVRILVSLGLDIYIQNSAQIIPLQLLENNNDYYSETKEIMSSVDLRREILKQYLDKIKNTFFEHIENMSYNKKIEQEISAIKDHMSFLDSLVEDNLSEGLDYIPKTHFISCFAILIKINKFFEALSKLRIELNLSMIQELGANLNELYQKIEPPNRELFEEEIKGTLGQLCNICSKVTDKGLDMMG